jgi:hypothetical protein
LIIINIHKLFIGLLGSIFLYLIFNQFVVDLSIQQYIVIEALITIAHWIYIQIMLYMNGEDGEFTA